MKKILLIAFCLCALTVFSFAQQDRRANRQQKIESARIAFITKKVDLTPAEAQKFWPIFNKYEAERKALRKEYRASKRVNDMSNAEAEESIAKRFDYDEKELVLKKRYYSELKSVLSPKKIVALRKAEREFKEKILQKIKERKQRRNAKRN